jgi:hypothetical protein
MVKQKRTQNQATFKKCPFSYTMMDFKGRVIAVPIKIKRMTVAKMAGSGRKYRD